MAAQRPIDRRPADADFDCRTWAASIEPGRLVLLRHEFFCLVDRNFVSNFIARGSFNARFKESFNARGSFNAIFNALLLLRAIKPILGGPIRALPRSAAASIDAAQVHQLKAQGLGEPPRSQDPQHRPGVGL